LEEDIMSVVKNPTPGMTIKELKEVYLNRKQNGIEKNRWKYFIKKYIK